MVNTRPWHRQSKGDVHRPVKGNHLDRDVSLVVVHADDGVISLTGLWRKGGVARHGAGRIDTTSPCRRDRRRDYSLLLTSTEQTVFAGMGIEPADQQPRRTTSDPPQRGSGQIEDIGDSLGREQRRHLGIADVGRHEAAGDVVGILQHAATVSRQPFGEEFGMAGVVVSSGMQRFFVERPGHHGCNRPGRSRIDGRQAEPIGGLPTGCRDPSRHDRCQAVTGHLIDSSGRRSGRIGHAYRSQRQPQLLGNSLEHQAAAKDHRQAVGEFTRLGGGQQPQAKFRADTGWVAHRDRKPWRRCAHDCTAAGVASGAPSAAAAVRK